MKPIHQIVITRHINGNLKITGMGEGTTNIHVQKENERTALETIRQLLPKLETVEKIA